MQTGATISGLLHVAAVGAVIIGLPVMLNTDPLVDRPIIVELVTIDDVTVDQTPPTPEERPEPRPEVAPPAPEPQPEQAAAPPAPPPPAPSPSIKFAAATPPDTAPLPKARPEPVFIKPKPEPQQPPPPEAKPKPEEEAAAKPVPFKNVPRPTTRPVKKPNFDVDRIAALLDKSQKKPAERRTEPPPETSTAEPPVETAARSLDRPLTISEIDAIRFQIEQCWSVPAGARDAEELIVKIRVFLNPDGSLAKAPEIVGNAQYDGFYRTAAESALRAVVQCSPLKNLPPRKYARWRELTLTFNPRQMIDG